MKTALTLALILLLAGLIWKRRERVGLALKVGAALYAVLMVARLATMRDDSDQLTNLGLAIGGLMVLWLVVRGITVVVEKHRARRARALRKLDSSEGPAGASTRG